ncbi:hypothetical protein [Parasitella parasitica]|uniref:Coilin n=1 Tax=Parasitella parasitica TaxID=35722 RepID=A0A0B7NQS0_9FUNG|nr:hypothetical protein [Parasitella parasitica]
MRIKITTAPPLPKNQCWFAINEKLQKQSIYYLTNKIVDQLNLSTDAANLKLSMEGFYLLPQTTIRDLLRDGDLVIIKEDPVKQPTTATKKRKSPIQLEEVEEDNALDTRPIKKSKRSKSSIPKDNDKNKADKDISTQKVEKKSKKKGEETKEKKNDKPSVIKENTQQSAPFEGLDRTKKRNMRRKALKQHYRMLHDESNISVIQANSELQPLKQIDPVQELHVEKLKISANEPSEKLLKKNKNKKKNHMKGSKAENRSHVFYEQQQDDMETNSDTVAMETVNDISNSSTVTMHQINMATNTNRPNLYGRAFVTSVESEPKCKGHRGPARQYPIHKVPTLFYAEEPSQDESSEPSTTITMTAPQITDSPDDYNRFPAADFKSNIPAIGDQLAIKTLELTANYTPEISAWKQVILKEMNLPNTITFEYIQGFGKTSTKGGKFDIKKHQKKRHDGWYQDEYDQTGDQLQDQEEEEGEEADLVNEDEQEQDLVTINIDDIYDIKNMSNV